jgi:hypothetical protein
MIGDFGGFLDAKNSRNVAHWRWRWHLQGGSKHWMARSLKDLRNDEDLKRWRNIEFQRRHTKFGGKVVNLAAVRIQRGKRQKAMGARA